MVVLLLTPRSDQAELWRRLLSAALDGIDFRVHPNIGDPAHIDAVLAWKPPHGVLATLSRLKLICSLGMGVDHLLADPLLPQDVPIARLVDPNMIEQMSEYVLYAALHFHRGFDVYQRFQSERRWEELPLPHTAMRRIGIMGLGAIGTDCARRLAGLGFSVRGWSRTPKALKGVRSFSGRHQLAEFLGETDILVSVLPLTRQTARIVDARLFAELPPGASFINVARGELVVEDDLLAALDCGRLAGAMLDVTVSEPLAAASPLWAHPKVRITPHIAGLTNPVTAVEPIAENLRRLRAGLPLRDLVDRIRGY